MKQKTSGEAPKLRKPSSSQSFKNESFEIPLIDFLENLGIPFPRDRQVLVQVQQTDQQLTPTTVLVVGLHYAEQPPTKG
jgi:hypothetical protein